MIHYSIEPRDWTFVKSYGVLFFAKNIGKTIGKNKSKNLSRNCNQKFLDHSKKSSTDAIKTASKKQFKKMSGAMGNLVSYKFADGKQ